MMRETLLTGTGRKAEIPGWEAAGKTGTTQDFRDAWFVGYTARLVTAVWLGNDDNTPMKKVSGGGLPSEIWGKYMKAAHVGMQPVPLPGGLWRTGPKPLFGDGQPVAGLPDPARDIRSPARPNTSTSPNGDRAWTPPPAGEKGFLERLFGG